MEIKKGNPRSSIRQQRRTFDFGSAVRHRICIDIALPNPLAFDMYIVSTKRVIVQYESSMFCYRFSL